MFDILEWYLPYLLLTLLFEVPPGLVLLRKNKIHLWKKTGLLVFINCISHPLAVLTLVNIEKPLGYWQSFYLIEVGVFILETILWQQLFKLKWHSAVLNSLLSNGFSAGMGCLISF